MNTLFLRRLFILPLLIVFLSPPKTTWAEREPYVAPPYVPPPPIPSRLNLVDNGDGTITETKSQLMWTQKDSFADLGRCLNWHESVNYVDNLTTGGHTDWRMPLVREYGEIYEGWRTSSEKVAINFENQRKPSIIWVWNCNPRFALSYHRRYGPGYLCRINYQSRIHHSDRSSSGNAIEWRMIATNTLC
jgi:hypothetical protein